MAPAMAHVRNSMVVWVPKTSSLQLRLQVAIRDSVPEESASAEMCSAEVTDRDRWLEAARLTSGLGRRYSMCRLIAFPTVLSVTTSSRPIPASPAQRVPARRNVASRRGD